MASGLPPKDSGPKFQSADLPTEEEALKHFNEFIVPKARQSFEAYCTACFKTEEGEIVKLADFHREWLTLARKHNRLILWCPVEHGKSTIMSVWLPLWTLARRPDTRIVIVSNTEGQAEKFGGLIRDNIDRNPVYRKLFPHVRPGPKGPWTDVAMTIKRKAMMKDRSIQCIGVHGAILGARIDILILDDILDMDNTYTPYRRKKLIQWIRSTLITRMTDKGRIICIGTKWHKGDAYHTLARKSGFKAFTYKAIIDKGTPAERPLWPERWPMRRIIDRMDELGPLEAARTMMNDLTSPENARFDQKWFSVAQLKGRGQFTQPEYYPKDGEVLVCGVDLSIAGRRDTHRTAFHFIAATRRYKRHVYMISGPMQAPEIKRRLLRFHQWMPEAIFAVESNQAQMYLIDLIRDEGHMVPIIPIHTSKSRLDRKTGVERVSLDFGTGKWVIPEAHDDEQREEIEAWLDDMGSYQPTGHPPDRLIATYFASQVLDVLTSVPDNLKELPAIILLGDYYAGAAVLTEDRRLVLVPCVEDMNIISAFGWIYENGRTTKAPSWYPGLRQDIQRFPIDDTFIREFATKARDFYDSSRIAIKDPYVWGGVARVGPTSKWPHREGYSAIQYMALAAVAKEFFDSAVDSGVTMAMRRIARPSKTTMELADQQKADLLYPFHTSEVPMSYDLLIKIGMPSLPNNEPPSDDEIRRFNEGLLLK